MTLHEHLANLARTGDLAAHEAGAAELQQHLDNARPSSMRATNRCRCSTLQAAYGASHAADGGRSSCADTGLQARGHRQTLFGLAGQSLPGAAAQPVLADANNKRNKARTTAPRSR
ncbi:MAG: hypothetical protein U1E95_10705 [Rubrivivax sp.]